MSKMKADTWKTILQIAISIFTALATSLGVSSCMVYKNECFYLNLCE